MVEEVVVKAEKRRDDLVKREVVVKEEKRETRATEVAELFAKANKLRVKTEVHVYYVTVFTIMYVSHTVV